MKNSSIFLLVILAVATRIIPHPSNMTAISAMALLAGAGIESLLVAMFVPLAALFITDLALGFHDQMWAVYGAVAMITWLSKSVLGGKIISQTSKIKIAGISISASLLFFAVTNLAVWWQSTMYTHDMDGFVKCFTMALPFLENQMIGDLFYSALLLTVFSIVQSKQSAEAKSSLSR